MITFHLDRRSGVPPYLQLVQQVKLAVSLGLLRPGDRLPSVKDVVGALVINPNTVLKAYRQLEHEGVAEGRQGVGVFVAAEQPALPPDDVKALRVGIERWIERARTAGLNDDQIAAVFAGALRPQSIERVA
jgi:GntR family transcriptional regulator